MKRYRHTGLRGCVIMLSPWKYLTIPKKETDHENPRNASHPGRHCRQPARQPLAGARLGCIGIGKIIMRQIVVFRYS